MIRTFNLHSVAALALATALLAAPAAAQDAPIPVAEEDRGHGPITTSQDIVVPCSVGYRNRTEDAEPVLSSHSQIFQPTWLNVASDNTVSLTIYPVGSRIILTK